MSRPRPCGDGALWEIWAAGASHAGGSASESSGHSAAAVPAGDDGRGISVLCLFQPGPGGTGETTLNSPWGHWPPPFSQHGALWQAGLVCARALFLVFHGHQSACKLSLWSLSYFRSNVPRDSFSPGDSFSHPLVFGGPGRITFVPLYSCSNPGRSYLQS